MRTLRAPASTRRDALSGFVCGLIASLPCNMLKPEPAASGRIPPAALARRFEADYEDVLHPMCERHIRVERDPAPGGGWIAHYAGTDVGPEGIGQSVKVACNDETISEGHPSNHRGTHAVTHCALVRCAELYKLRTVQFDARISADGNSIDAGDGVHVGQFRTDQPSKEGGTWSGIRWNDGNKWVVTDRPSLSSGTERRVPPAALAPPSSKVQPAAQAPPTTLIEAGAASRCEPVTSLMRYHCFFE